MTKAANGDRAARRNSAALASKRHNLGRWWPLLLALAGCSEPADLPPSPSRCGADQPCYQLLVERCDCCAEPGQCRVLWEEECGAGAFIESRKAECSRALEANDGCDPLSVAELQWLCEGPSAQIETDAALTQR